MGAAVVGLAALPDRHDGVAVLAQSTAVSDTCGARLSPFDYSPMPALEAREPMPKGLPFVQDCEQALRKLTHTTGSRTGPHLAAFGARACQHVSRCLQSCLC